MDREVFFNEHEPKDLMKNMILNGFSTGYGFRKGLYEIFQNVVPNSIDSFQARLSEVLYEYVNLIKNINNSNTNISDSLVSIENNKNEINLLKSNLNKLLDDLSNYKNDLLDLSVEQFEQVSIITSEISKIKKEIEESSKLGSIENHIESKEQSLIQVKDYLSRLKSITNIINMESMTFTYDGLSNYNPEITDVIKGRIELEVSKYFNLEEKEKKDAVYFFEGFLNNYAVYIKEKSIFEKKFADNIRESNIDDIDNNELLNRDISYFNIIRKFSYRITSSLNAVIENGEEKDINNLNEITIVMYFITTLINKINNNMINKDEILYIKAIAEKNLSKKNTNRYNAELYNYLKDLISSIENNGIEEIPELEEIDFSSKKKKAV